MAKYDFRAPRLFVNAPLAAAQEVVLAPDQAHYLRQVMRLADGAETLVFNGRDGEWLARLSPSGKRGAVLQPQKQIRLQPETFGPIYAFAPLKQARLDYMVQKAVEMGASRLSPVLTQFTQVNRMNMDRMRANAIEAAEQCGILVLPEIDEPMSFEKWLAAQPASSRIVFCDEDGAEKSPVEELRGAKAEELSVLVGPEGGFSESERRALLARGNVIRLSLGPRILRADTAAVAALALVQAVCGDWR
ncbi:MAG: 16S rRNA (uracil(1498)-N(3))-methyltransferase [Xanthobacteraceae bacterium]|nr:16S rRNA (uracil(1498)-N(3))-methyltransferase [Xanthobacteraceae bacterium]MBX3550302.1 16S rRNA (uracil(1498)-N(3))-methyltransferase [Xanthobacteraceae bacterium]